MPCIKVGALAYLTATAAFIEAWNEISWADMLASARVTVLRDDARLAVEMHAANDTALSSRSLGD